MQNNLYDLKLDLPNDLARFNQAGLNTGFLGGVSDFSNYSDPQIADFSKNAGLSQGGYNFGDFSKFGLAKAGQQPFKTQAFNPYKRAPLTKFEKGMGIAGGVMDGANLIMNYQQMQAQNKYNDQNMAILQEQQGLAKRAHDVNFANQQSMQRQMV